MQKWWHLLTSTVHITISCGQTKRTWLINTSASVLILALLIFFLSSLSTVILAIKTQDYFALKAQLACARQQAKALRKKYDHDVGCLKDTLTQLQQTEQKLRALLKLGSKEQIIKKAELEDLPPNTGAVEIETIKKEIENRLESLSALKDYLQKQKSIYLATPEGWPTKGYISSPYGWRIHPITGMREFHHGVDIAAPLGTPVRATANGIVVYAGKTRFNGNFVIIEHGYGYSTLYAHLKKYKVKIGQRVERGDVIGYVGSTGLSTGPHLHYEVWKHKRRVNPIAYILPKKKMAKRKTKIAKRSKRR